MTYPSVRLPVVGIVVCPSRCLTSPVIAIPTTASPASPSASTPTSTCVWVRRPGRNAPSWRLSTICIRIRCSRRNIPRGSLSSPIQVRIRRSRGSLPSGSLWVLNVRRHTSLPSGGLPSGCSWGPVRVERGWPHVPSRRLAIQVFQTPIRSVNGSR